MLFYFRHTLSITEDVSDTVRAVLIEQTAHCAHEYPSSPNDPPALVAARQQIEEWRHSAVQLWCFVRCVYIDVSVMCFWCFLKLMRKCVHMLGAY